MHPDQETTAVVDTPEADESADKPQETGKPADSEGQGPSPAFGGCR